MDIYKIILKSKTKTFFIQILLYSIILSGISFTCGLKEGLSAMEIQKEIVNPHWTGKHCIECHLDEYPQGKRVKLRYEGDTVKLCNRCHETEFARADIHPVEVAFLKEMKKNFPKDWPLKDGKLNCLTCHEALLQMRENFAVKITNPKFIRGAPYETLADFCFSCHQEEEYQKINPHKQLDAQGRIIESRCLFCHQSLPHPEQVENIGGVSFKSELAHYCISCHSQRKTGHPARADHLMKLPDSMKESLTLQFETLPVKLPLDGESIFCGTCHNPHEKGVIQREEAQHGAGERFFLRLSKDYELCVSCHGDKRLQETTKHIQPEKDYQKVSAMILSSHEPTTENKCKICHSITPENREKPRAVFLCFKQGCHKADILEKEFIHEKSVVENCYLCHRSHSSMYKKLLINSEEKLCRTCHPLLRDKNDEVSKKTERQKSSEEHNIFMEYLRTTPITGAKQCGFCHSAYHKAEIGQMDMETCSDCHIYVHGIVSSTSSVDINVHQTFQEKRCSACHNPHAAQYRYLLKKPQESYFSPNLSDSDSPSP